MRRLAPIALVSCFLGVIGQGALAQGDDAHVLAAAIAHYSTSRKNPLLIVAGETIEANHISLGRFERGEAADIPASIVREVRHRNSRAESIGDVALPANARIVRDAISMTRHATPTGAEVADWSPFTHAYPGYQLLQVAAPAYFTPGDRALVYFWVGIGSEGTQGWLYVLEKRGAEWHVTWSESPWVA